MYNANQADSHTFFAHGTPLPPFMAYPRFLLDCDLSDTAKLIYILLLDRAKLSGKNKGWTDEQGRVFLYYTIRGLAEAIHKSEMTVKAALAALERTGLLVRKRQGVGKPNRIYIKLPIATDEKPSAKQTENFPSGGQFTVHPQARKLSTNQVIEQTKEEPKERCNDGCAAYGTYHNVLLSKGELASLRHEVPDLNGMVDKLSCYMASTGRTYQSHAAALRSWALRDKPMKPNRNYECEENESL